MFPELQTLLESASIREILLYNHRHDSQYWDKRLFPYLKAYGLHIEFKEYPKIVQYRGAYKSSLEDHAKIFCFMYNQMMGRSMSYDWEPNYEDDYAETWTVIGSPQEEHPVVRLVRLFIN